MDIHGGIRTQLISDTHGKHREMDIDESVDMIVHAGDSTNCYDTSRNQPEFEDFLKWYSILPIKYKVVIAGNHDAWALSSYNKLRLEEHGIIYLQDEMVNIEGKKILGSPWSPNFGNWHFMKNRSKLARHWDNLLVEDIDLLITHTPPKGVLDLVKDRGTYVEKCGCSGLFKAVNKYKPKHHVFGHIHSNDDIVNFGERVIGDTRFYNASSVRDGDFGKPPVNNKGIIINM